MTNDGSEEHVAWVPSNCVIELEDFVVPGPTFSHSRVVSREDSRDRLRHRRLLRHVQRPNLAVSGHRCVPPTEGFGGVFGGSSGEREARLSIGGLNVFFFCVQFSF